MLPPAPTRWRCESCDHTQWKHPSLLYAILGYRCFECGCTDLELIESYPQP